LEILDQKTPDGAIVVALGSNMAGEYGAPDQILERAIGVLDTNGVNVLVRSRLWRSRAWPDPTASDYRNAVCLVETALTPTVLMQRLHEIENAFGRERSAPNAPRTLDLDLIAYGRRISGADPVLPHPRAADRRFVMGPLAELYADWRHPITGLSASKLADEAKIGQDAAPLA